MKAIYVLIGYFIGVSLILLFFIGCATTPVSLNSKDTMLTCKQLCRGDVRSYTDDTIECACQDRGH